MKRFALYKDFYKYCSQNFLLPFNWMILIVLDIGDLYIFWKL